MEDDREDEGFDEECEEPGNRQGRGNAFGLDCEDESDGPGNSDGQPGGGNDNNSNQNNRNNGRNNRN